MTCKGNALVLVTIRKKNKQQQNYIQIVEVVFTLLRIGLKISDLSSQRQKSCWSTTAPCGQFVLLREI